MGYLLDVILTRDTWMHRVDIARATGRALCSPPSTTAASSPTSSPSGPAATAGRSRLAPRRARPAARSSPASGGEEITLDAVEFCRILSGRATGAGLLTQEVPF